MKAFALCTEAVHAARQSGHTRLTLSSDSQLFQRKSKQRVHSEDLVFYCTLNIFGKTTPGIWQAGTYKTPSRFSFFV